MNTFVKIYISAVKLFKYIFTTILDFFSVLHCHGNKFVKLSLTL